MKIQKTYGISLFVISMFWALWLQLIAGPRKDSFGPIPKTWFLSSEETLRLPEFKTIDTRSFTSRIQEKLPNVIVLGWEDISLKESPFRGKLQKDELIRKKLLSLGMTKDDLIIVLGDGKNGWGEEGRIVWSLREVGYPNVYWYQGSFESYKKMIETRKQNKVTIDQKNKFYILSKKESVVKTDISKEEITKQLKTNTYQILDTRESREYTGATPYGEFRGGHIPGAKSFYYQNVFDDQGNIKSKEEVEKILTQMGIIKTKPIIAYCTGGVRSAFVVGILRSYGYQAYNYSGSMWEWSYDKELPLEK
ncbi:MAG: sulfurtransferase [Leptospira bouyouniensis]